MVDAGLTKPSCKVGESLLPGDDQKIKKLEKEVEDFKDYQKYNGERLEYKLNKVRFILDEIQGDLSAMMEGANGLHNS